MTQPDRSIHHLLSGACLQTATYAAGIAIGLLLTPYLVRTLGDRDYAIFLIAGLFTNWCGLIDFGMTTAVSRFITFHHTTGDDRAVNETANTAFGILVLLAAIAVFAGLAAAGIARFSRTVTPETGLFCTVFIMTGITFAVSKITDGVSGIINGTLHQQITGWAAFVLRLATGVAAFAILYFGGRVVALLTGSLILAVVNLFVLALFIRPVYPAFQFSPGLFRKSRVRQLFGYSVWTFVNQIGDLMIQRSDLIVIGAMLPLAMMTHYNLAVVVFISYYGSFLQAMTLWETNWFTRLMKNADTAELEHSRLLSYKLLTYLTVFMSFLLIFWGQDFLTRWVGSDCLDAFPALVICASIAALYRGCSETNIRLLQGLAEHRFLALAILVQGVITVAGSILLIQLGFGLTGVAIATALPAFVVHELVVPLYLCRLMNENFLRYFLRQCGFLIRSVLALILPGLILIRYCTPAYPRLFTLAAGTGILYLGTIFLIGLNKNDRSLFFAFFRKKRD